MREEVLLFFLFLSEVKFWRVLAPYWSSSFFAYSLSNSIGLYAIKYVLSTFILCKFHMMKDIARLLMIRKFHIKKDSARLLMILLCLIKCI